MLDSEGTFGSNRTASVSAGYYASPVHPHTNVQFMKTSMQVTAPTPPQYLAPPPYPYAENQFSANRLPVVPVNQYNMGYPQYSQMAGDPRVYAYASNPSMDPYSFGGSHVSPYTIAPPPFQPASYSPEYSRRLHHRSQPPARRTSLSDSSDSDEAQEISDRIMRSSDDPRELGRILKSTGRKSKKVASKKRRPTRVSYSELPRRKNREKTRRESSQDGLAVLYDDGEIPAARFDGWFDEEETRDHRKVPNSRSKSVRKAERNAVSAAESQRARDVSAPKGQKARDVSAAKSKGARDVSKAPQILAVRAPRAHLSNDKQTVWWNASSSGKRQRLPPADWRKGERYISAPDGTKVGLTGWKEVVCTDDLGWKNRTRKPHAHYRAAMSTADEESPRREFHKKVSRKEPVVLDKRLNNPQVEDQDDVPSPVMALDELPVLPIAQEVLPVLPIPQEVLPVLPIAQDELASKSLAAPELPVILQAFDFMKKNKAGVYCLGSFKLLHRRGDRKWGEHDVENGFTTCPSITTRDLSFAELALDANMPFGKLTTLDKDTSIVLRVVKAAPNAIRVQINKHEERLNEEDELKIEPGATYSLTNLSKERTAVLSMVISHGG